MLQLREEHHVIGLREDDFEEAMRDQWQGRLLLNLLRTSSWSPFFFQRVAVLLSVRSRRTAGA